MPIDFHADANRTTYAGRQPDPDWASMIRSIVDPASKRVVDVGCGGGIYAAQWAALGAASVVGVDFSDAMLSGAREANAPVANLTFRKGDALATGLPDGRADIVFERALIHHVADLAQCFREARRILAPGGLLVVQDRTLEDCARPGAPDHLRGYFFECFPRLLEIERKRRPSGEKVAAACLSAGLPAPDARSFWETRRIYASFAELASDLTARTGRSILHELSDAELADLIAYIRPRVGEGPVVEKDCWTVWSTMSIGVAGAVAP